MHGHVMLSMSLFLLTAAVTPVAHADIYKCKDEHGNVAYLQTPCPVQKAPDESADENVVDAQADEEEEHSEAEQVPSSRQPGEDVDDCKKRYRNQIDEIDAEMRTAFSPEQGVVYKKRLLALTQLLRACE